MRKLVLNDLNLSTGDILERSQLSTIFGGCGDCYKCCDGNNCSGCVQCDDTCICRSGSTKKACASCN